MRVELHFLENYSVKSENIFRLCGVGLKLKKINKKLTHLYVNRASLSAPSGRLLLSVTFRSLQVRNLSYSESEISAIGVNALRHVMQREITGYSKQFYCLSPRKKLQRYRK